MLVYDAGTWDSRGFYAKEKSRLSSIAGVDYALYDSLKDNTFYSGFVWGGKEVMQRLQVPPGKFMPIAAQDMTAGPSATEKSAATAREFFTLDDYVHGHIQYPSMVTRGSYNGEELLHSGAGTVAGLRKQGTGTVLFVNLPLSTLATHSDALWLHGFLYYFADSVLNFPLLAGVPDGIGGIVLNWHMDYIKALDAMQ